MGIENKVKKYIKKWAWLVEGYGMKFSVVFFDTYADLPREHKNISGMGVRTSFLYMEGTIYVNLEGLRNKTDEELEEYAVHELTHFLLSPYNDLDDQDAAGEIATTLVSRALVNLDKRKAVKK